MSWMKSAFKVAGSARLEAYFRKLKKKKTIMKINKFVLRHIQEFNARSILSIANVNESQIFDRNQDPPPENKMDNVLLECCIPKKR